jgi:hypothetical protein
VDGFRSPQVRALVALLMSAGLPALAQRAPPAADVEQLWLDGGGQGGRFVPGGALLPGRSLRVGVASFFTLGQVRAPGSSAPLVGDRLGFQVFGAAGVLPWLEVGAVMPVVGAQAGVAGLELAGAGLGNPWLHARASLLGDEAPVAVAMALGVAIPVGTAIALGNGGFEFAPRLHFGRAFAGWQLAGELGLLVRPRVDFSSVAHVDGVISSSQAWVAAAVTAPPGTGARGEVSVRAFVPLQGGRAGIEAQLGVRWPLGPVELFASAGPGFGGEPTTPWLRAVCGLAFSSVPPPGAPVRVEEVLPPKMTPPGEAPAVEASPVEPAPADDAPSGEPGAPVPLNAPAPVEAG